MDLDYIAVLHALSHRTHGLDIDDSFAVKVAMILHMHTTGGLLIFSCKRHLIIQACTQNLLLLIHDHLLSQLEIQIVVYSHQFQILLLHFFKLSLKSFLLHFCIQ